MRNMSFTLTTDQVRNRTKTVTRRLGWKFLKAGDQLWACVKCMGLKKGEKPVRLAPIRVTSVTQEELRLCTTADAAREGFPQLTGEGFVSMFCGHMNCGPTQVVTRIEFEYLDVPASSR